MGTSTVNGRHKTGHYKVSICTAEERVPPGFSQGNPYRAAVLAPVQSAAWAAKRARPFCLAEIPPSAL